MEKDQSLSESRSTDPFVEQAQQSFSDRLLEAARTADRTIDAAGMHLTDSLVEGGRAFIGRLLSTKSNKKNSSQAA